MQQASAALDVICDYAALANQSLDEFAQTLAQQLPEIEQSRIFADLKKQYPNSDEALLQMLAKQQADTRMQTVRQTRAADTQNAQQAVEEKKFDAAVARWTEVGRLFPEIKNKNDVPTEVYTACEKGADPVMEMYKYRLTAAENRAAELEKQLQTEKQNNQNKQSSTGSMGGTNAAKTDDQLLDEIFAS